MPNLDRFNDSAFRYFHRPNNETQLLERGPVCEECGLPLRLEEQRLCPICLNAMENRLKELNELQGIVDRLNLIQKGDPAAILADLSLWLHKDAPRMTDLLSDLRNSIEKMQGTED
jgi:hypothetical protein